MPTLTDAAASIAGTQLLRRAKWSWLGYGVAAYVGLRLMRKFGIFENQADQALRLIDRTVRGKTTGQQAESQATVH